MKSHIISAQRGDQDWHCAIADQLAETSSTLVAVQRNTMVPLCQRFTRSPIWRTRPC